ncbi:MAG: DUF4397 domain-containing protein [Gemmatimonadales bacterium]
MRDSIRGSALVLMGIALACAPSRSREQLETTTEDGRSTSPSVLAANQRGATLIRVVNAMPDASIDIAAGQVLLFRDIGYEEVTAFQEFRDNVAQFTVRYTGQDSALATNREAMGDGARYTIVALHPMAGETKLRVLRDELTAPNHRTKIRVINAVTGASDLQVLVMGQDDPMFGDIDPGLEAGYREIEPMTGTLIFKIKDGAPLARLEDTRLEAGRAYTIVLAGADWNKVEIIRFEDRLVGGQEVTLKEQ